MQFTNILLAAGSLVSVVLAHPGHGDISSPELHRRGNINKRCASAVGSLNKRRYNKRNALRKRDLEARSGNTTFEITTQAPFYDVMQNETCVLTPDVTEGPYVWPRSQTLRQDMTEDEPGVPFTLDVGVIDVNTCEPMDQALVSFWHCNATGSYSSFTGISPNTPFGDVLDQMNITIGNGTLDLHTDDTTFLRGMWPTDSDGLMEMNTIIPGFYVERAIHIHVEVFTDWAVSSNGTISSGNRVNTGQIYINETMSQQLMALEPYASHTQINRTTNDVDSTYAQSLVTGYYPVIDLVATDGVDIANGVIGYITIGVDPTDIQTGSISVGGPTNSTI